MEEYNIISDYIVSLGDTAKTECGKTVVVKEILSCFGTMDKAYSSVVHARVRGEEVDESKN